MIATSSWLIAVYSISLVLAGWGFDVMARRTSEKASQWRNGNFHYDKKKDAWKCPHGQWLLPTEFDPTTRQMCYQSPGEICEGCAQEISEHTTPMYGHSITRPIDPWPHSETGHFHRGIACAVSGFGLIFPILGLFLKPHTGDVVLLAGVFAIVLAGTYPLLRHLWNTPTNAPDDNPAHIKA